MSFRKLKLTDGAGNKLSELGIVYLDDPGTLSRHGDDNNRWEAGQIVSILGLLAITLLTVTRGETPEDPEIILVGARHPDRGLRLRTAGSFQQSATSDWATRI